MGALLGSLITLIPAGVYAHLDHGDRMIYR